MRKNYFLLLCFAVLCFCGHARAAITVTAATGGTNICSDLSATGATPAFKTLGNIVLTEGFPGDMTNGVHFVTIAPPAGWSFGTTAPGLTFTAGRNVTSVNLISITAASLIFLINVGGATLTDAVTISGLQVQANTPGSGAGNIRATAFAGLTGISAATNFGALSVAASPGAVTVTGGGTYCDNTTINASIPGAGTIFYEGGTSGSTLLTTPATSQSITLQGTHTYYFRAHNVAGNCYGIEGSATVTINNTPGPITVTPVTSASVCDGSSADFVAAASSLPAVEILQQDFNSGLGGWAITNGVGTAASWWKVVNSPGYLSAIAGDGSKYAESAPDATGSSATPTNTILTSPSFSTVGYIDAAVSFNQYYQIWISGDTAVSVEYSTDGGTTWTTIVNQVTGVANVGTTSWNSLVPTTTLALPAGAIGMPDVKLRWNYNSDWGYYWGVDNIAVNGTPDLVYTWAGVAGATGLSCTTCTTTTITPATIGDNVYTVTTTAAGCTSGGSVTVTENPLPTAFNVTGGGTYCASSTGVPVGLDNSETGVDYQLYVDGSATGGTMPGSVGLAVDFGTQTVVGTYTVSGTYGATGCTTDMLGSVMVDVASGSVLPIVGDNNVCLGAFKTLTDATTGGTWSSMDNSIASVSGTGAVMGVGMGSTVIVYTSASLPCPGIATVNMTVGNPMPAVTVMPAMATLCHGNPVNMVASAAPVLYQWETGGSAIPGATDMNYSATAAGSYTLVVDNGTCTVAEPAVNILPNPTPGANWNTSGNYLYTGSYTTYQWLMNGTAITGATSSIYPPTVNGSYAVVVTDVNGCTDTSAAYAYSSGTAGVNNVSAGSINVYPNPASSVLHIDAPMNVNITMISPDGRVVITQEKAVSVNIGGLANGVYMIMVYDEHNMLLKTSKFTKID
jgi:hypothetical protein